MIGLALSLPPLDLHQLYHGIFAEEAPDLDLRGPQHGTDPAEVEFVFTFRPPDDGFTGMTNLRAIFSAGAGVDAIMACPSRPTHVPVFRVEDADQALQMAGYAAFHVHWHHRDMPTYLAQQPRGEWRRTLTGLSPTHRRVAVLGFGHMGRAIARGLVALGYPVVGIARRLPDLPEPGVSHITTAELDAALPQIDILINVLPLTEDTRGLIDRSFLNRLPQGAALIHMGRGGQVVEADLLAAIDAGHISGASLDVFETEPLPPDHPLWTHPRILITPHVASIPERVRLVRSIRDRLRSLPLKDAS